MIQHRILALVDNVHKVYQSDVSNQFNTYVCKDGIIDYTSDHDYGKIDAIGDCALEQQAVHFFPHAMILVIVRTLEGCGFFIQKKRMIRNLCPEDLKCLVEIWRRWLRGGREHKEAVSRWLHSKIKNRQLGNRM